LRKAALILLCLLLAFVAPSMAQAQEDGPAPMLVMSQFQCDWNRLGDIGQQLQLNVPIWEEMVAEGSLGSAGSFFHQWADEWNVTTYMIGDGIESLVAANDEANSRFTERHPDATAFAEACPRHRDNFYQFGPIANSEGIADDGNPALIISMYECDYERIGEVFEQYAEVTIPVQDALIQEGQLRGAGTFAHVWADEWNLGFYWTSDDIPTFIEAWNESNARVGAAVEAAGLTTNALAEACPIHKDAIYTMGPRTGMDSEGSN